MVVDCQNRITQMELTHKATENKFKQDISRIDNNYEVKKHKIELLQKDALNLRRNIESQIEQMEKVKERIEETRDQGETLVFKEKEEVAETVLKLKKEIKGISDITKRQDSSLSGYRNNLTKYDIIVSDCQYKIENALRFIKNFSDSKVDQKDFIPKVAKLEREVASLRIAMKKGQEEYEILTDKNTDIYLQTQPAKSIANDNLKIFVKLATLIAKTVASEEHLEILQKYVKEKVGAFEKMTLENIDPNIREKEAEEK